MLELLIALLGCTIVFGIPLLGEMMRPVWQTLWNYQPTLVGLRFIVSFLILLMPTTLMGLTLPVLIEDPMLRQMTEKMSRTAEVHLVAAIRKNCDKENHRGIESHASDAGSIKRNCFVDWIWEKLKTDFGFHPPR